MQTGDELVDAAGENCPVENIRVEIVERPEKVYNFKLEAFHIYYAGNSGGLVYNAEYGARGAVPESDSKPEHMTGENGTQTSSKTTWKGRAH